MRAEAAGALILEGDPFARGLGQARAASGLGDPFFNVNTPERIAAAEAELRRLPG